MAKKRMFSLGVLDTDAFLDMPLSAQALYFHLNLRADDDGFVGNPKRITQNIGASLDDLRVLIAKRFLLTFEDGVIVIKHWRMHNVIKKDRYTATNFEDDMKLLCIKGNGSYTFREDFGAQLENERSAVGAQLGQMSSAEKGIGLGIGLDKGIGKGKKARTPKLSNLELYENLTAEGEPVQIPDKVKDWLGYKTESGFTYTKSGMRGLLKAIVRNCEQYGASDVSALIDECIEKGWKGIIWDRLKKDKPKGKQHNFEERTDDLDEMALEMMRQSLKEGT